MLLKVRHRLYHWLAERQSVCNANAYFTICRGQWNGIWPDSTCQRDFAANGHCWCGKLDDRPAHIDGPEFVDSTEEIAAQIAENREAIDALDEEQP